MTSSSITLALQVTRAVRKTERGKKEGEGTGRERVERERGEREGGRERGGREEGERKER